MAVNDEGRRGLYELFHFGSRADSQGSELRRLLEVNRALASELEPRRLYAKILDAAVELTGAERAFLLVREGDADPEVAASRNLDREEVRHAAAEVSGTVVKTVVERGA